MPEFEEEDLNASQSETYTPSTDASEKRRTRRRSGGFKNEVVPVNTAKIGEVDAAKAIKEEKLSGPQKASAEVSEKPENNERRERKPRTDREPRKKADTREPRRKTNPEPSAETLAAIASVESKIAERKAERDARRAERDKNRPAKSSSRAKGSADKGKTISGNQSKSGVLAAISEFFGKLFGGAPEPTPKDARKGGQRQGGRPQGKGDKRGGQNRSRGNNRGGQNRRRGGKGPRRSDRRTNEQVES